MVPTDHSEPVSNHDTPSAWNGVIFISAYRDRYSSVPIIDMDGKVLHGWQVPLDELWMRLSDGRERVSWCAMTIHGASLYVSAGLIVPGSHDQTDKRQRDELSALEALFDSGAEAIVLVAQESAFASKIEDILHLNHAEVLERGMADAFSLLDAGGMMLSFDKPFSVPSRLQVPGPCHWHRRAPSAPVSTDAGR